MPTIEISELPEETHAVLLRRANAAHQSLEHYLRSRLIAEASGPTLDEVLDRASSRTGGSVSFGDAIEVLRQDRARR